MYEHRLSNNDVARLIECLMTNTQLSDRQPKGEIMTSPVGSGGSITSKQLFDQMKTLTEEKNKETLEMAKLDKDASIASKWSQVINKVQ